MSDLCYIYTLDDPDTGEVRYVGKSTRPIGRFMDHLVVSKRGEIGYKCNWIRYLLRQNKIPRLSILESCNEEDWIEREMFYISLLRNLGCRLLNRTDGGEGSSKGQPKSDRMKKRLSESLKGKPKSPEHIAAMIKGRTGITQVNKGRPFSPEHQRKIDEFREVRRGRIERSYIQYILVSPQGEVFLPVSIIFFCQERGLNVKNMRAVALGRRKEYRGWFCTYKTDDYKARVSQCGITLTENACKTLDS